MKSIAWCFALVLALAACASPPDTIHHDEREQLVAQGTAGLAGDCTRGPNCSNRCTGVLKLQRAGEPELLLSDVPCAGSDRAFASCDHLPPAQGPFLTCQIGDGPPLPYGAHVRILGVLNAKGGLTATRWEFVQ